MDTSTPDEKVDGAQFKLRIPAYDISQRVKEANEALRKDDTPSRETKEVRVKFGPTIVHYEPDRESSLEAAWGETGDGAEDVSNRVEKNNKNNCDQSSYCLLSDSLFLQKKQADVSANCNKNINSIHYNKNSQIASSTEDKAEHNVADSENKPVGMQSNASYQIEFKDLDHDNQEISFSKFCEILNDMEFNETCERKDKVERLSEVEHITKVSEENVGMASIPLANEGESTFDTTGDSEIHESILKQEENIEEQFAFPSEEFIGIKPQNFNNQVFEFDDEIPDEEDVRHQNQSAFSSIKDESELSVSQKSQYKHLMHHKWSNSRLPAYNGLNSEYGLTAEMLEERKRKAEIIRQKLWEKKKKEEEIKEQKKKDNDESFRDWLRKKEAERKKSAEEKKNYEFVYDHEEAENAFQAWLKRKAKELRQQKKQNEAQKEYEMQLALRRTFEESQREFKRWLRTKVKKSSPPGKHKSYTFRSMRKSHKRYVVERDVHMKNTCKIYLGR